MQTATPRASRATRSMRPAPEAIRDGALREPAARRRRSESRGDKFFIPPSAKRPGVAYEWKRETLYGKDDPTHLHALQEDGAWQHVPASEMPMFGAGAGGVVRVGGLVLMQRPVELSREARVEDYENARNQVLTQSNNVQAATHGEGMVARNKGLDVRYDELPSDRRIERTATSQLELDD